MGVRGILTGAGSAAALLLAGPAGAQEEPVDERVQEPESLTARTRPVGFGLQLGGGLTGFGPQPARGLVEVGGGWDVRLTYGTRSIVGVEAAYVGSAQTLNDVMLPSDAYLLGNGAEAALRLNLPVEGAGWSLVPFVLAGVGWNHYRAIDLGDSALLKSSDNVLTIPVGAGLSGAYRGFLMDARFTYRPTVDDELFSNNADMHTWTAGVHLGRQF